MLGDLYQTILRVVCADAKAKYRGLSTAAAKTPPPVEMTWI
jgi:hypothetical protein